MKDCTCKITPGTSAYGGNQIDSRGCDKHDTRDEIIATLRARLAEVEAERDAALERAREARKIADKFAEHCGNACKQLEAVERERDALIAGQSQLYAKIEEAAKDAQRLEGERDAARGEAAEVIEHYGDPEEDETLAEVVDRINKNAEEGWGRAGDLQAALLTAQAGEARAVELCVKASNVIRWCLESITRIDPIGGMEGFPDEFGGVGYDCEVVGASSPALAWLAQRDAEVAAKALERVGGSIGTHWETSLSPDEITDGIRAYLLEEAAALRAGATGGSDD